MRRLWVQLTLAFALVALVAVGAIALLIGRTTDSEFRRYITNSEMNASGSGLAVLVDYYHRNGGWEGIETPLAEGMFLGTPGGRAGLPRWDPRPGKLGPRLDLTLADASGRVVFDSAGTMEGKRLSAGEKSRALPVTGDDGEVIGHLLLSLPGDNQRLGTLEQRFLESMRSALFAGAVLAVGLGLVMGLFLSRSLTAPLQRLAIAARAVAAGDLGQQVQAEGSTEMAEVGQAFNEMTDALAKAETLRQNMVADVAHELRTPLSVVQGNLQAILDDIYPLDMAEISRLYDETRLLSRLVDDLRDLAQADAGQLQLNLASVDVAEMILRTTEALALGAKAQEVTLTTQVYETVPAVRADPDRLVQILRNLLVNALRHTQAGGKVIVTAKIRGGSVEIAVSDTGAGIGPEELPHVFDRFWRAERSRTRTGGWAGGSGLGLSVTQSLVEAQGGRIWVQSEPGQGSTFRFTLPVA
jgi:two-component system OmpR family sensor kinase/two-component system sensor histidine kinase BaeS